MADDKTYKGWTIDFEYGYYVGIGPDYDASYEGPEDGWVDNGHRCWGRTINELKMEIDAKLEEIAEGVFHPSFDVVDEIPTDDEVLAAIGSEAEGRSPSDVLEELMGSGHNRANAQRAIQRVLDRGKIEYSTALKLIIVAKKLAAEALGDHLTAINSEKPYDR